MQIIIQPPAAPGAPVVAQSGLSAEKAIELIQGQIGGVKKEIADLTSQLTNDVSGERANTVRMQIEGATERLESLHEQLDRAVAGQPIAEVRTPRFENPNDIPPRIQSLLESGMVTLAFIVLGYPLIRMIARRLEPKPRNEPSADTANRFERLEQAVDAVAIEVERISEGQRFTNRILSDTRALPAPNPLEQWPQQAAEKAKQQVR